MKEKLVITGNGMAAARLAEKLISRARQYYDITILGDEPGYAYNRVLLSSVVAGDFGLEDLPLKSAAWWAQNEVITITGSASAVDLAARVVQLADGRSVAFTKLVFATGSSAIRLPIPGSSLPGVSVFRTVADATVMTALAARKARVVVIGGGLLGIEAAYGLAKRGARVTLLHIMDRLMERQLDAPAAAMVKAALQRQGIEVVLEASTSAVLGENAVEGVALADGRAISADAVIMAAGIRPNAALAQAAGLTVKRGVVVDSRMETSQPGVYAIGECAEVEGQCCGLVEPAYAQADILARRLTGDVSAHYMADITSTNLKVSGLPVFSAGDFMGAPGTNALHLRDPANGLYKKLVLRDGKLAGAVLVGDTSDGGWYLDLIRSQACIANIRNTLAFGKAFCGLHDLEKQAA